MNDIGKRLSTELDGIVMRQSADEIRCAYRKKQRKNRATALASALAVCAVITTLTILNAGTGVITNMMNSAAQMLSGLAGTSSETIPSPALPASAPSAAAIAGKQTHPTVTEKVTATQKETKSVHEKTAGPTEAPLNSAERETAARATEASSSVAQPEPTDNPIAGENFTAGDFTLTLLSDGTLSLKKYSGREQSVIIPGKIDGYVVSSIDDYAFTGQRVTRIHIPDSISSIGSKAFCRLYSLRSFTADSSNKSYAANDDILYNKSMTKLICSPALKRDVSIPAAVKEIGDYAFYQSETFDLKIPKSVTKVGDYAFYKSPLPKTAQGSFREIGDYAFYQASLTAFPRLSDTQKIGNAAFYGNSCGSSVTLPSGLREIGLAAFGGCHNTTSVRIDTSADFNSAFEQCTNLKTVTFTDKVTRVSSKAFYRCTDLSKLNFSPSIETIGISAFSGSGLSYVQIPAGITIIGANAFSGCPQLGYVSLPKGLGAIGDKAFYQCQKLIKLKVPSSVTKIGTQALGYSSGGKTNLTVSGYEGTAAQRYCAENELAFESLGTVLKTKITLKSYIAEIKIGKTYKITATVTNPKGSTTFTSADKSIATVGKSGIVRAKSKGSVVITVQNNGVKRKFTAIIK